MKMEADNINPPQRSKPVETSVSHMSGENKTVYSACKTTCSLQIYVKTVYVKKYVHV